MDERRKKVPSRRGAKKPRETRQDDSGLWDANDVALFLKVSRSWVYKAVRLGEIPCLKPKVGALIRFDPKQIRAFLRGEWNPPKAA